MILSSKRLLFFTKSTYNFILMIYFFSIKCLEAGLRLCLNNTKEPKSSHLRKKHEFQCLHCEHLFKILFIQCYFYNIISDYKTNKCCGNYGNNIIN